jgi:hypothetical protein
LIGEEIVEDLKHSLLSPSGSFIAEIEPEEEPVLEPVKKLSEVKEESETFTSIELDPEDELWDNEGKGLDFNPAVSLVLRNF